MGIFEYFFFSEGLGSSDESGAVEMIFGCLPGSLVGCSQRFEAQPGCLRVVPMPVGLPYFTILFYHIFSIFHHIFSLFDHNI